MELNIRYFVFKRPKDSDGAVTLWDRSKGGSEKITTIHSIQKLTMTKGMLENRVILINHHEASLKYFINSLKEK